MTGRGSRESDSRDVDVVRTPHDADRWTASRQRRQELFEEYLLTMQKAKRAMFRSALIGYLLGILTGLFIAHILGVI